MGLLGKPTILGFTPHMGAQKTEPSGSGFCSAIALSAAISACEKGKQWDKALMLLEDMRQLHMLLGWQGNGNFHFFFGDFSKGFFLGGDSCHEGQG